MSADLTEEEKKHRLNRRFPYRPVSTDWKWLGLSVNPKGASGK